MLAARTMVAFEIKPTELLSVRRVSGMKLRPGRGPLNCRR